MQAAELEMHCPKDLTLISQKLTKIKLKFQKSNTSYYDVPYFVSSNKEIKKFYNLETKKILKKLQMISILGN